MIVAGGYSLPDGTKVEVENEASALGGAPRPGVALAVALLVIAGRSCPTALPRGLYPELSFPRIVVVATLADATADIVLRNVTRPLEEALPPVLGVQRVRSQTIRGAAEISLQFEPDADMVAALQLVQARLAEVRGELPAEATLVAERVTPTSFPVLTLNVDGAVPPAQLRDVALYQVRPALSRVPGVGPITVTAGEVREVEVEVDPARAEAAGLTVDDDRARVSPANQLATVGRSTTPIGATRSWCRARRRRDGAGRPRGRRHRTRAGAARPTWRASTRATPIRGWRCARRAGRRRWSTWRAASAATCLARRRARRGRGASCAASCRPASR